MGTYTLAISDDVLFACLPDEADIAEAVEAATSTNYGFGLPLRIVRGTVLTDRAGPRDDVIWRESPDGELLDADGRRYRYAVRRAA